MLEWDINQSKELYNIERWGEKYFDIDHNGEMTVAATPAGRPAISLYALAKDLINQGFSLPVLIRFPDIVSQRVERLCNAFQMSMEKEKYHANYMPVYPIKVNQRRQVIETIVNTGQAGLEAGSKSELMAALALAPSGGVVICNGYKDRDYIRTALIGQEMGLKTYIVIEKTAELKVIIQEANQLGITPRLGLRIRLASIGKGKWQDSGGENSKFGLNASQIIDMIDLIADAGLMDSLQLMHFHIGSQIPGINDIQKALCEASRFYSELISLGAPVKIVNMGGGLGVDYEGMLSNRPFSVNYTIEEYANNVVYEFKKICAEFMLPEPDIITETGRAITAHHALLVTNIIDVEPIFAAKTVEPASENDPAIIQDLWHQLNNINLSSAMEVYHNAVSWLNETHTMFSYGVINIRQRAHAEKLFYTICLKVRALLQTNPNGRACHQTIAELNDKLADKYFGNFSLFKSAPDAWAIEQLFPIAPLSRLNEYPDNRSTLQDLTCDSDGRFKKYAHCEDVDASLPTHSLLPHEPYLVGIFLLGAYQEVLGSMHNLFGNTRSVDVHITENGGYEIVSRFKGDTVQKMLADVNFDAGSLLETYEKCLRANSSIPEQRQFYMRELEVVLNGYTYFEG